MTSTLDLDPARLALLLGRPRREGARWRATCPSCGQHTFTVGLSDDGQTYLVKCWGGCSQWEVIERLKAMDLWPTAGRGSDLRQNGHQPAPATAQSPAGEVATNGASAGGAGADPLSWLSSYCAVPDSFVAALPIERRGEWVAFTFPSGAAKRRKVGTKDLRWDIPQGGARPALWPLPSPDEALPEGVWILESETDAIVARRLGLAAFAGTAGASTPLRPAEAEALRQRGVRRATLLYDADAAGREGAQKQAEVLARAGIKVAVVDLAEAGLVDVLAGEKDLRDCWRAAVARGESPERLRAALEAAARPWAEGPAPGPAGGADGGEGPAALAGAAFGGSFLAPGAYPWPVMAEEAYYGLAGDVVRAVAPHTEADPVALLLSFLAAVSAALGPGPHVCVGETVHYLRVWPVLVGETAKARKGSSLAPVQRLLALAAPAFADRRIVSGLSSGEGLIWAVRDPITRWEKVKDPTTKVADLQEVTVDPGEPDKRLLVVEEEFAGVLKVLSRDGNTLSAVLRQAWERGDLRTLTKNCPGRASGAHIVVLGHAVSEELSRYLLESEIAGGLANRFLFACVRRSQCLPRGGRLPAETLTALAARLRQVFEWAQGQGDGELRWSDAAGGLWDEVYPALSEGKPGLVGALIARMEAQALRLAALSAVLDRSPEIQPEHLAAALAIVDYCEASARHIFGDRLGDPMADAIVEALRRAGPEGLSRWDLSNLLGRHVSSGRITHALAGLHAKGLARPERRETGGRPAEVWTWCGR